MAPAPVLATPSPGDIDVWAVDLSRSPAPEALAVLSAGERVRASRFAFSRDRDRYVASHAAMRAILAAYRGEEAADLALEPGPRGKPFVRDGPAFSLSHGGDVALVAVAREEIGVDVEPVRARPGIRDMAASVFTPAEALAIALLDGDDYLRAFLATWTRKEAFLKALGLGLALEPSLVEVGAGPEQVRACAPGDAGACAVIRSLPPIAGHVAAVASTARIRNVILRHWNGGPPRDCRC